MFNIFSYPSVMCNYCIIKPYVYCEYQNMFALASKPAQHSMFDSPNAVSLVRDYLNQ